MMAAAVVEVIFLNESAPTYRTEILLNDKRPCTFHASPKPSTLSLGDCINTSISRYYSLGYIRDVVAATIAKYPQILRHFNFPLLS
jgi:hypothetical protein